MPKFTFTSPDGRSYDVEGPAGSTKEQAFTILQDRIATTSAGIPRDDTDPRTGAPMVALKPEPEVPTALPEKVEGGLEAGISMATALPASIAGGAAGAVKTLTGGKYGTPAGAQEGAQRAQEVSEALTYQPRAKTGQQVVGAAGDVLGQIGPLPELIGMPSVPRLGSDASAAAGRVSEGLKKPPAAMPGVGAAETGDAAIRRARAADLPIPVDLTKGQASRDFEQQRFERETAKAGKVGQPLRERYAEQNEKILQNFDAWVDQTGAEAPDLRATGKAVDQALVTKAKAAKGKIDAAYAAARKAGEMEQPMPTTGIVEFVTKNRSAARNAPVISAVEDELIRLGGATRDKAGNLVPGAMKLNDLEELRQMVSQLEEPGTPNATFGKKAKAAIDQIGDTAQGNRYREARKLRYDYGREFEDHAVVSRLLRTKPGTADRAVALEDVFSHSVLNSSFDDLKFLRRTLQTSGETGLQAWRELQGQAVAYLKEQATKGATTDVRGNRIVSAPGLDKAVRSLDRDGKLEVMFGKKGAEQIRDINDLAKDVFTSPPGSVNASGTGAIVLEALSNMVVGKLPTAAAKSLGAAKRYFDDRKVRQRVNSALDSAQMPVIP